MNRTRWRLLVACLAAIGAAIAVAGGSAGNRTADVTFQFLPGDSVTYGENFYTKTTIKNLGSSMFTQLELHHQIPATEDPIPQVATLAGASSASCATQVNEVVCTFDQLPAGATLTVSLLWDAPASGAGCTACLKTDGFWFIKERKSTNLNEFFPFPDGEFSATLLGGDASKRKAAGYEIEGGLECEAGEGNLHTSTELTSADPVSSTVCLPEFTVAPESFAFGYSSAITEVSARPAKGSHKELGQSVVCVAALGQSCVAGHTSVVWGTTKARHIFLILESAINGSSGINKVYHNGAELPLCSVNPTFAQGCVVDIIPPAEGSDPRVWTVIADAPTNGPWNW